MTERTIFLAALELAEASERAAYVKQACGEDAALRAQVEALLTTHEESGGFLETPAASPLGSEVIPTLVGTDSHPEEKPGKDLASAESEFRRYLQPSSRPGWLGRLGHYEIEAILGRGAFGVVAKAFDDKLHRVVAIKMLHPELAATSPPRQRFIREARTAAAVQHENIVGIYAVEEEPIPYLVMEYVPGESLQQRLDRIGPLNVPDVLRTGRQLAAGLAAAHAAHLIHRDIKPSNILLTGGLDDRAKISDFGLARAVDDASLTQSGVIAGTPMYMAPEQARGETLDHRADLFSLGSVLYQMASGRPPFRAGNTIAVLKRVCEDAPRPLTDVIPGTPEWLQTIIFRLLEKDRNRRFQTATEVAQLLERCQTELRVKGFVQPIPELDPKLQATTVEMLKSASESKTTPAGGNARGRGNRAGLLSGLVVLLAVLAAMPYVGQRLARWFDTPIPTLPKTELTAGLRFDGRDDYVAVTGLDWDYPQFTIEAMVTSSNASGQGTIAHLSGGTAKAVEFMALYDGAQADPGKRASGARIQGKSPYVNAYGPFAGEVRQHRALSFDGRYLNYYINGVWQGQRFAEPHEGLQWRMTALHIGCDGEQRSRFQGVIDQVRISRVARYTQNFPPVTSLPSDDKTLAMYDFREGKGETLRDVSGNGHDGKIVGAEWVNRAIEPLPLEPKRNPPSSADAPKPAIIPFDAAQAKRHQEAWAAYLKVPVEYTNSIGMKFRLIPPGEFTMGSTAEEIEAAVQEIDVGDTGWHGYIRSESPRHKVVLTHPVYMGTTELTQAHYEKVMGANPSHFHATGSGQQLVAGLETSEHPVERVSWYEAAEFCSKLSEREKRKPFYLCNGTSVTSLEGTGYRLPGEAEWEFACRAGTSTKHWLGDRDDEMVRGGWFRGNSAKRTHRVGELSANPFGLFDVHGNVWEWTQDEWDANSYAEFRDKPAVDPVRVFPVRSPRVIRGGDWGHIASVCRSSGRRARNLSAKEFFLGLRVALSVEAVKQALSEQTVAVESDPKPGNWPADAPKPAIAPFDAAQAKRHQDEWATFLKVPVEYTSSIGMKFRLIPPGEFLMGAPDTDADAQPYEKPQHSVTLTQAYYMGATEVTVGQFRRFVEATKYVTEAESDGKGAFGINPAVRQPDNVWNGKTNRSNADDFPVRCVSWQDASRYCEWLSQTEGRTARLPTEAEWEFACRAGTRTRYSFGNSVADTPNPPRGKGAPFSAVAKGPANPFGLHEMHGNVHEICWDAGRTYTTAAVTDPIGSLEPGSFPAIRGGAVSGDVSRMRSSHRYLKDGRPFPDLNFATPAKGFRVVLVGPLTSSAAAPESPQ